ncbi:MAG: gluconate 2-dehydrogenase subunit 3 family protein [Deltaproteobacteria bacterium]|nr:gluconate 2-dehydrogenase subunit 3 family protein [Deltaproteobacteria bacterium]
MPPPPQPPAFLATRRGLLRMGAGTAAVLSAGSSLFLSRCNGHYDALVPAGQQPRVLSGKQFAVLATFVDCILPDEPGWPTAVETRVALRIDHELAFHHDQLVDDFRAALYLVEYGDFLHGGFTRFTRMTQPERDAHLHRMQRGWSLEKQAFINLRLLAVFFHYTDERTWQHIGYAGPMFPVASRPPADNRA